MATDFDRFFDGPRPGPAAPGGPAQPQTTAPAEDTEPTLPEAIGAGLVQGGRDVGQTLTGWTGIAPEWHKQMEANTAAARQRYGSSLAFNLAENLGGMATTVPLTALATAFLPEAATAGIAGAALTGAIAGGGSNLLMSGGTGENPLVAAGTGALGGAVLGGGARALGGLGAGSAGAKLARQLGFDLSTGEQAGGLAKNVEDVTKWMPFSGAAAKTAEHTKNINQILGENIGLGPVDTIDNLAWNQAKTQAGRLMDQVQHIPVDVNNDPSFLTELANTWHAAGISNEPSTQGLIDHIVTVARNNGGILPGQEIHNLISRGGPVDLALGGNRAQSWYAGQIKDSLLDAAERASAGNPAYANFQQGRAYWKAIKTIENSIVRNPDGSEGMSWQGLKNNIFKQYDMTNPGTGRTMQNLALVLNGPLKALQETGTGRQNFFSRLLVPGGTAMHAGELGGIGALAYLNPSYVANVAVPTFAGGLLGRAMRFGPDLGPGVALAPWRAMRQSLNPLLPRAFGPLVGRDVWGAGNALAGNQSTSGSVQ